MNLLKIQSRRLLTLGVAAILVSGVLQVTALADVADSTPGGFTVKITVNINAAPADVYRRLVNNVGDWWDSAHTFSTDAHNLSIEERPMGCFCEKLKEGGAVRHMEVLYFQPGKTLRMSGALGPMQGFAVNAIATFTLSPAPGGTKLELTYAVGGYMPQGLTGIAPIVDKVLTEQVNRLKSYIETGKP